MSLAIIFISETLSPYHPAPSHSEQGQSCTHLKECSPSLFESLGGWINRNHEDIEAVSTLFVALFTIVLATFTIRLAKATDKLVIGADNSAEVSRKIGEAQVRAYVSIKTASIEFISTENSHPRIIFTAANTGQSPARNFIWNVTLQYPMPSVRRGMVFDEKWLDKAGIDIPATNDAPQSSALVPYMSVKAYVEAIAPGTTRDAIRLKINFRFTDVFDRDWFGEAYFGGVIRKRPLMIEDVTKGVSPWAAEIFPVAKPTDWNEIENSNDEKNT